MAALIRDAVDRVLPTDDEDDPTQRWQRALGAVGKFEGQPADVSGDHDSYLDGAFAGDDSRP